MRRLVVHSPYREPTLESSTWKVLLAFYTNFRLGWKSLPGTLTYHKEFMNYSHKTFYNFELKSLSYKDILEYFTSVSKLACSLINFSITLKWSSLQKEWFFPKVLYRLDLLYKIIPLLIKEINYVIFKENTVEGMTKHRGRFHEFPAASCATQARLMKNFVLSRRQRISWRNNNIILFLETILHYTCT